MLIALICWRWFFCAFFFVFSCIKSGITSGMSSKMTSDQLNGNRRDFSLDDWIEDSTEYRYKTWIMPNFLEFTLTDHADCNLCSHKNEKYSFVHPPMWLHFNSIDPNMKQKIIFLCNSPYSEWNYWGKKVLHPAVVRNTSTDRTIELTTSDCNKKFGKTTTITLPQTPITNWYEMFESNYQHRTRQISNMTNDRIQCDHRNVHHQIECKNYQQQQRPQKEKKNNNKNPTMLWWYALLKWKTSF